MYCGLLFDINCLVFAFSLLRFALLCLMIARTGGDLHVTTQMFVCHVISVFVFRENGQSSK